MHHAALDILENIGLADAIPSCVEAITAVGGHLSENGRLLFPPALVEDMLAKAAKPLVLHGRDPRHDMDLSGQRVHFGTAGAAVHLVDLESGIYRDSTLRDLYDIARLVDTRDNIHFFQRAVVARDVEDPLELDINTTYASLAGTAKHVGTSFTTPQAVQRVSPPRPRSPASGPSPAVPRCVAAASASGRGWGTGAHRSRTRCNGPPRARPWAAT